MTLWLVLGGIVLALFLISLVRVGGFVEYSKDGVLARLKLGPFWVGLYPVKEKKEKRKKKKEKAPKATEEPTPKPGGGWARFRAYLPLLTDAAGRFKRKIRIDKLYLDYTAAAADPAMAAMEYGCANVAVGMIWPLFAHNFKIKERRIRTAVDFQAAGPTVYVCAALSLTLGQAIVLGLRLAIKFLKITAEQKTEEKPTEKTEKEAV